MTRRICAPRAAAVIPARALPARRHPPSWDLPTHPTGGVRRPRCPLRLVLRTMTIRPRTPPARTEGRAVVILLYLIGFRRRDRGGHLTVHLARPPRGPGGRRHQPVATVHPTGRGAHRRRPPSPASRRRSPPRPATTRPRRHRTPPRLRRDRRPVISFSVFTLAGSALLERAGPAPGLPPRRSASSSSEWWPSGLMVPALGDLLERPFARFGRHQPTGNTGCLRPRPRPRRALRPLRRADPDRHHRRRRHPPGGVRERGADGRLRLRRGGPLLAFALAGQRVAERAPPSAPTPRWCAGSGAPCWAS